MYLSRDMMDEASSFEIEYALPIKLPFALHLSRSECNGIFNESSTHGEMNCRLLEDILRIYVCTYTNTDAYFKKRHSKNYRPIYYAE